MEQPEPTVWECIKRGARNHPGTPWLLLWVAVAWGATGELWAGAAMLLMFGPFWLWGAYSGGRVNLKSDKDGGERCTR